MTTQEIITQLAQEGHEVVICAAVRFKDKVWRGNRHDHALEAMHNELSWSLSRRQMNALKTDRDQGFVTSKNRYVGREEAYQMHTKLGIPSNSLDGYRGDILFSEDLY